MCLICYAWKLCGTTEEENLLQIYYANSQILKKKNTLILTRASFFIFLYSEYFIQSKILKWI